MSQPTHIVLEDWAELEPDLRRRLRQRSFTRMILFRNFDASRLPIVLETGTDRDDGSPYWEEEKFDFCDAHPDAISPKTVIYAHRVNHHTDPFQVLNLGDEYTNSEDDLTCGLRPDEAVLIYDPVGLDRVAFNEHWFTKDPREVLLFIYTIAESQRDEG
jgi:hypothetical protein